MVGSLLANVDYVELKVVYEFYAAPTEAALIRLNAPSLVSESEVLFQCLSALSQSQRQELQTVSIFQQYLREGEHILPVLDTEQQEREGAVYYSFKCAMNPLSDPSYCQACGAHETSPNPWCHCDLGCRQYRSNMLPPEGP